MRATLPILVDCWQAKKSASGPLTKGTSKNDETSAFLCNLSSSSDSFYSGLRRRNSRPGFARATSASAAGRNSRSRNARVSEQYFYAGCNHIVGSLDRSRRSDHRLVSRDLLSRRSSDNLLFSPLS